MQASKHKVCAPLIAKRLMQDEIMWAKAKNSGLQNLKQVNLGHFSRAPRKRQAKAESKRRDPTILSVKPNLLNRYDQKSIRLFK